ncbi:choline transporter [Halobacillus halophilus]|uniref:BCCT family transporter n=1 Tax=Halobacillus halophilus (strain ATCC 35676 / DSM 2266 / JCM 20832 / KCTC 3685 / LMG 17431 / NBRC 102448 / NCIMB 2269) TaxID=866895 RepID=I0JJC4_HALH3|nr:BCCT family transporter [Halobacillus halophilus]ASF38399.1 choline transporter [Halobacillus halophilus]CCG44242.1 BCCT family transporter [Halobacillus halophilus DSM 2266]
MKTKLIDWPTFIGALILLVAVTLPLILFPEAGKTFVADANSFMTGNFGVLYMIMGFVVFAFLLFVAFSKNGSIKLGDEGEKPEFNTFSWAAMLFAAGIGSSILYWAVIEWAYYYQGPPFGVTPESQEAIQWASAYGIFHWGPIAWAIYTLPALPIAYFYYVRKKPVLKVSEAVRPVLGKSVDGPLGTVIDVLFMFGLLGGAGTTLALGTPMIAEGVNSLTGIPANLGLKSFIMLLCTLIFAISSYSGLKRGIKVLSDINLWLSLFILAFVFIFGPTRFISETTVNGLGILADNFFKMATWMEPFAGIGPFGETNFPESWTIFYWAWWLVYAPFVGLFVARISRGRTIRQMVLGTMIYGTIGCILFFGIMGNFGLYMQLTGSFDAVAFMDQNGAPATIIAIINQLPLAKFMVLAFTVLAIIFLATTFDSSSYILASVVQKSVEGEPMRWNRLFWAFALCLMPLALMFLGGLGTLQTASIVGGFPLIFIMILLAWSFMRASSEDIRASDDYQSSTIHIERWKKKGKKRRRSALEVLEEKNKDNDEEDK